MTWRYLHKGYYLAQEDDHEYVVRTRPLNDGWMAIADDYVVATGLTLLEAKRTCEGIHEDTLKGELA